MSPPRSARWPRRRDRREWARSDSQSGYRSYELQVATYQRHVRPRPRGGRHVSARPGHSEHQSGLAVDVVACASRLRDRGDSAARRAGQWIAANCLGVRLDRRATSRSAPITGYKPEPWHLRYVGRGARRRLPRGRISHARGVLRPPRSPRLPALSAANRRSQRPRCGIRQSRYPVSPIVGCILTTCCLVSVIRA